jgi:hypothetical protein
MAHGHDARTLTVSIDRPAADVYAFASNVENLPRWATAFVRSVRKTDRGWIAETTDGPVGVEFAPANALGVLDHVVRPAPGLVIHVPMRVVANGARAGASEVMFTLFQLPGMSDEKFAADVAMVERDLATLKRVVESM